MIDDAPFRSVNVQRPEQPAAATEQVLALGLRVAEPHGEVPAGLQAVQQAEQTCQTVTHRAIITW